MGEYRKTYEKISKKGNDNFKGTVKNDAKFKKYERLQIILEKLLSYNDSLCSFTAKVEDTENTHQNALIYIETENPAVVMNDNQRMAIAELILTADDFVVAKIGEDMIRFSFGVRGLWN